MTENTKVTTVLLNGSWDFALDPERRGIPEKWYLKKLSDQVHLPGTTDSNGKGTGPEKENYRNLNRRNSYMGQAWYQKKIWIPDSFLGKHITLFLERCLWDTMLWVDDGFVGSGESLAAPHVFDLTDRAAPGEHVLTLMVDNSNLGDETAEEADTSGYRDLSSGFSRRRKRNCGGHHTAFLMSTNWNGVTGAMELRAQEPVRLEKADIYPTKELDALRIRLKIANQTGCEEEGELHFELKDELGSCLLSGEKKLPVTKAEVQYGSFFLELPEGMTQWSEFTLVLYHMEFVFRAGKRESHFTAAFGLRYLEIEDNHILLNGHRVFLRGTVENCTFPLTFAPPCDRASWDRIFKTAADYGLNHFRFHSFCPPEAAFDAADRAGFLLQIELGGSSCPDKPEEEEDSLFLRRELERILYCYGGHPSFGMLSMGNEQLVALHQPKMLEEHQKMLNEKVDYARKLDPRHLYTCTSHPCTRESNSDYFVSAWTMKGWDAARAGKMTGNRDFYLNAIMWGGPDPLDTCIYCTQPPTLAYDYDQGLTGADRPFICHEAGQWEVFPDVREIPRFCGVLEAGNLKLIREDLEKKGMLALVPEFVRASGKLSLMLYRDEIETMLKSRKLSGFQLLDLTDYPGQGTSTVGLLDAFWNSKGLVLPEEFRRSCSSLTMLLRSKKRVYTAGEVWKGEAYCANYRPSGIAADWRYTVNIGWNTLAEGGGSAEVLPGEVNCLGEFVFTMPERKEAYQLKITLELLGTGTENSWDFWVYPQKEAKEDKNGCSQIITQLDESAEKRLREGEGLLLLPEKVPDSLPGVFTTVFWNPQMKKQTGTFGICCNPTIPALRGFPNEGYTQWQWWDILGSSQVMNLDNMPVTPQIRVIDSYMSNRKLGLLFEAAVEKGRLLVCSAGLQGSLEDRPASRWLKNCLLRYLMSGSFCPQERLTMEQLKRYFKPLEKGGGLPYEQ